MKVLIVEDNRELLKLMSSLFSKKEGYDVLNASSFEEANEKIQSHQDINTYILDIKLDESSGLDLAPIIKKYNKKTDYNIIFSSGSFDKKVVENIDYDSQKIHFFSKPYPLNQLYSFVHQLNT